MTLLRIANVHKSYADLPVLAGIDLAVDEGEIVCLLGPSGCGKTTLLRIVAGLERPDQGELHFAGEDLRRIPVHRRHFGLMFQEFALFPHKSVGENVAFGLRMAQMSADQIERRVAEMLTLVDLKGYQQRSVHELSGGERQRVALARSLAPNPRLLMLDEPLGSLDRSLREELMAEVRTILKRVGVTALYVTHDQQEAFAVADRVVVMEKGHIEQIGTPEEVYERPATRFVARFLGLSNLLPATVTAAEPQRAQTPVGSFHLASPISAGTYTLLIRPEIERENVDRENTSRGECNVIAGTLTAVSFRGSDYYIDVAVPGDDGQEYHLDFVLPTHHRRSRRERLPKVGDPTRLDIECPQLVLL